jgi:regulator of nucleoside diphosphate kinase
VTAEYGALSHAAVVATAMAVTQEGLRGDSMTSVGVGAARERGAIYVTASDRERLLALVEGQRLHGREDVRILEALEEELERALVVDARELPTDVVTLDSRVGLVDLDSGEEMIFTLVLPSRANANEGRISVLAPLGMAVLGYRANDVIEWDVPSGRRKLRVRRVIYQPEAASRLRALEPANASGPR